MKRVSVKEFDKFYEDSLEVIDRSPQYIEIKNGSWIVWYKASEKRRNGLKNAFMGMYQCDKSGIIERWLRIED